MLVSLPSLSNIAGNNMARQIRKNGGTGIYHVMLRGINRQDIFEDDVSRQDYNVFRQDYNVFQTRLQVWQTKFIVFQMRIDIKTPVSFSYFF